MKCLVKRPDPICHLCNGNGFVVCEDDNGVFLIEGAVVHSACDCIFSVSEPFIDWLDGRLGRDEAIPEAGEEVCLSVTVMLTNPDYISDGLPTWENDSADVNPINLLFGEEG